MVARRFLIVATVLMAAAAVVFLKGCESPAPGMADVVISGKKFTLEVVNDPEKRNKGLSGRTEIKPDGGMLFVFPKPEPTLDFVMRDCPIPIDIIYLDGAGRVVASHKMVPEPPRSEEEKVNTPPVPGAPEWSYSNKAYEKRLKKYPSRFASQFVIELKGNTLDTLKVQPGDKVALDIVTLKKQAK